MKEAIPVGQGTIIKHSYEGKKEDIYGTVMRKVPTSCPLPELVGGFVIVGNPEFTSIKIDGSIVAYSYMDDYSKILKKMDYGKITETQIIKDKDKNKSKKETVLIKTSYNHEFTFIF